MCVYVCALFQIQFKTEILNILNVVIKQALLILICLIKDQVLLIHTLHLE